MAKFEVEFEFTHQYRCHRVIEAESLRDAEIKAEGMLEDIPESEFIDAGYSEREFYITEQLPNRRI